MGLSCVKQKLPKENINDVKNFLNVGIYSKLMVNIVLMILNLVSMFRF